MGEEQKLNTPITDEVNSDFFTTDINSKQHKRSRMIHDGILVFIFLNLIALYILHFVDRGSSSSSAVAGAFKTSALSASSASTKKGNAMSFGPDGNLRVGAGTTAYLDAAMLPSDKPMSYIQFSNIGMMASNAGIMTYQQGVAPSIESVVTTFTSNPTTKKVTIDAAVDKNVIKGSSIKTIVTLSSSLAAVLYVTSSADGMKSVTSIAPVTISTDKKVELLQANAKEAATNSATNFITRLYDTSFAMVYYEPYNPVSGWMQRVQVGMMDKDNKISFSNNASFGTPNNNDSSVTVGQPQSVLKSNDRFIVPWFGSAPKTTNTSTNADARVGLCLTLFAYFSSNNSVANSQEACESQYRPAYFVQTTKLSDTELLFVFADAANKYALTVATVEVSDITRTFKFRGSYVISEATGAYDFGASFGFFPQPTVEVLPNNRLAVGFLNPSNSGKPSVKILKYSSDLSIEAVSPVLPISNADFSIVSADPNAFGGIVMDMIALETGVVVSYSGSYAGKKEQRVALVESFGKPVGLVSKVDGSDVDIALSGAVEVDTSLTSGKSYFAATNGQLYAASTSTDDQYVLANDNKMVISKNAMIGVAVSKKKLFVSAV